jgi:VanZ family protein
VIFLGEWAEREFQLPNPRRRAQSDAKIMESPAVPAKRSMQWIWPLLFAGVIVFASSHSRVAAPDIRNSDKIAHFGAFGLLATLVCRLGLGWRGAVWGLTMASAFGATDEWHQSFVPGRSSDVFDWIADTLGAALAVGLYVGWARYRNLLEWKLWARGTSPK